MDTGHFPSESDLLSLIQHVYETDANNESYALEWKSALVFKGDGLLPIVTNILGFANRDPSKAARFYDGYGHFVVGVEPGSVYGIDDPLDPADLTNKIGPYVGDDGPLWKPTWLTYPGTDHSILVITVAPPRDGDPIHTMRKQLGTSTNGQVYLRRSGQTRQANSAELRVLQERLLSGRKNLSEITVLAIGEALESVDLSQVSSDHWRTKQEAILLQPLEQWEAAAQRRGQVADEERKTIDLDALRASIKEPESEASSEEAANRAKTLATRMMEEAWSKRPEDRTPEEYRREVTEYLDECIRVLPYAIIANQESNWSSSFQLELSNPSDRNIKGLAIRVEFTDAVVAVPPDVDLVDLPKPPRSWGPRDFKLNLGGSILPSALTASISPMNFDWLPGYEVLQSYPVEIDFDPVDLRPYETAALPEVPMIMMRPSDSMSVTGTWAATSSELDGIRTGEFQVNFQAPLDTEEAIERCRRQLT